VGVLHCQTTRHQVIGSESRLLPECLPAGPCHFNFIEKNLKFFLTENLFLQKISFESLCQNLHLSPIILSTHMSFLFFLKKFWTKSSLRLGPNKVFEKSLCQNRVNFLASAPSPDHFKYQHVSSIWKKMCDKNFFCPRAQ